MPAHAAVEITPHSSLLTVPEAVVRSGLSRPTIDRYIASGRLPVSQGVRDGRRKNLINPADLDHAVAPVPVVPQSAADDALEAAIARAVAAAPPLSPAVRDRIISLLGGASA